MNRNADGLSPTVGSLWSRLRSLVSDRPVTSTLLLTALLLLAIANNISWGGEHWRTVLQADSKGYYAYLPAVFVQSDLEFGFIDEAEEIGSNPNLHFDYRTAVGGTYVNKYWCGTAVLQSPFFLVTHAAVAITGGQTNGYGKPYVMAVCLAAITYALLGLWALAQVLATYGISRSVQSLVIVVLMFGTHLFYYTIVAPGMSHVYSFALMTLFFLHGRRYMFLPNTRSLLAMGAILGLIMLVRPVNGLGVLALFFLADTGPRLIAGIASLKSFGLAALGAMTLALVIIGIQPVTYFLGAGVFWFDSYAGDRFNWTDPHMLDILFSYKKGLFLYTPICFVSLVGLAFLAKRSRLAFIAWAGFFVVLVYVLSSWWSWWYGGSFSSRPFVEYLPLFAIPLGLAIQHLTNGLRKGYVTLVVLLVIVCQIQTYQARYNRIHYEDMDRQRYWEEFLRLDRLILTE